MSKFVALISYLLVRGAFAVAGCLPHGIRVIVFARIYAGVLLLAPRLSRTVSENICRAFPHASKRQVAEIVSKHTVEIGRLVADTVRLPRLDQKWIQEHVACPNLNRYVERLRSQGGPGVLIATGHLGSFELMGHAIGMMGYPLAAVARRFRSPLLDRWWTGLRQSSGNRIIGRRGAFKEIVSTLQEGVSVAVLFDQNVTRNHAVFVDWFGTLAATTKSVALAALRTEVALFVSSLRYLGNDRYQIDVVECDCSDIYRDSSLTSDEKVRIITQRISDVYCKMIAGFPEGWFWMHRRWKTQPLIESLKEGCA